MDRKRDISNKEDEQTEKLRKNDDNKVNLQTIPYFEIMLCALFITTPILLGISVLIEKYIRNNVDAYILESYKTICIIILLLFGFITICICLVRYIVKNKISYIILLIIYAALTLIFPPLIIKDIEDEIYEINYEYINKYYPEIIEDSKKIDEVNKISNVIKVKDPEKNEIITYINEDKDQWDKIKGDLKRIKKDKNTYIDYSGAFSIILIFYVLGIVYINLLILYSILVRMHKWIFKESKNNEEIQNKLSFLGKSFIGVLTFITTFIGIALSIKSLLNL